VVKGERGVGRRGAVDIERRLEVRRLDRLGLALCAVGEGDRARRRVAQLDRERVAARRRDDAGVRGDDEELRGARAAPRRPMCLRLPSGGGSPISLRKQCFY
jgi:hypothetical protein